MNAPDPIAQDVLLSTTRDAITTLTLNRPEKFNSLSTELIEKLQSELDRIAADRSIRVVILAASGRGFCSGHDLKEIRGLADRDVIEAMFLKCSDMMMTIAAMPQPVIAKVHGLATAAGCQLVAACDLAIASPLAQFSTPGVNMGSFCATPSVALGRNLSRKHAMEMLLTANLVSAERAAEIGLINRVVADDLLDLETLELARLLTAKSAAAIATGKRVFYEQLGLPLKEAYQMASAAIAGDFVAPDGQEGVNAFLAKRPADFPSHHR